MDIHVQRSVMEFSLGGRKHTVQFQGLHSNEIPSQSEGVDLRSDCFFELLDLDPSTLSRKESNIIQNKLFFQTYKVLIQICSYEKYP